MPSFVFAQEAIIQSESDSTVSGDQVDSVNTVDTHDAVTVADESSPVQESDPTQPIKGKDRDRNVSTRLKQVNTGEEPLPLAPSAINIENNPGDVVENTDPYTIDGSGAFTYAYPVPVPPSRLDIFPGLSLQYSSHAIDHTSIVGRGWSFSIPSIQRLNVAGSQAMRLSTDTNFISSTGGELRSMQLTQGSAYGTYGERTETGSFNTYTFNTNNTWTVVDTDGTRYIYGADPLDRVSDPQNTNYVHEWMLSEIRDVHDNFVRFEYVRDQGRLYPARIVYTGHGSTLGATEILFDLETTPRSMSSSGPGFIVTTAKRIDRMRIVHNGVLLKKIELSYTQVSNSDISLLQSIQETGYDDNGVATVRNPLQFNYGSITSTNWSVGTSWHPVPINSSWGTRYADVNGDSRMDIIQRQSTGSNNSVSLSKIYLNTGTNFTESQQWTSALSVLGNNTFYNSGPIANEKGPKCLFTSDLNGDGYTDMWKVGTAYLNTGATTPGWQATAWPSVGNNGECLAYKLADIDGDGLEDLIYNTRKRISNTQVYYYQKVFHNTGTGFVYDQQWTNALINTLGTRYFYVIRTNTALNNYSRNNDVDLVDMNNDGYADLYDPSVGLYINSGNTGTGWVLDPQWVPPTQYYNSYKNIRFADTDGDTLTDMMNESIILGNGGDRLIQHSYTQPGYFYYNNNPQTFYTFTNNNTDGPNPLAMVDINSDKKTDAIWQSNKVYINQSQGDDHMLLKTVTLPTGGTVTVDYDVSAREVGIGNIYQNNSSSNISIVKSITTHPIIGTATTTQYKYRDAYVKVNTPQDKRIAGFGSIDTIHADGSITKNYYHQGNTSQSALGEYNDSYSKIGHVYRTEIYDNAQQLYRVSITKWADTTLNNNRYFVYPENQVTMNYDGNNSVQHAMAVEYTYDMNHGGILTQIERGSVTANNNGTYTNSSTIDDRYIETEYAVQNTRHVIKPKRVYTHDGAMNLVTEKKYIFDTMQYGQIDKGLTTTESVLIDNANYAHTQYGYNIYGLMIDTTDPLGAVTTTTYDTYHTYPAVTTNALGQSVHNYYDYSSGTIERTVDANAVESKTIFDGLDRPIAVWAVDDDGVSVQVNEYSYQTTTTPHYTETRSYSDANSSVVSRSYIDGFGRSIQERSDNKAHDTLYNQRGLPYKVSLPYSASGLGYTNPSTNQALYTTTQFDPLGRKVAVVTAVGTTSYVYSGLKSTITNARGILKEFFYDAFGNCIQVKEYNNGQIFTTQYTYNKNNNLTQITDAMGNVRTFTYDKRGLRTAMTDLHAQNDSLFGTYSYLYNLRGDKVSVTDPFSTTVTNYDVTGRPTSVDNTSTGVGADIQYIYDTCANGIGRLCVATTQNLTTEYAYTPQGKQSSMKRSINNTISTQKTKYDRQGKIKKITYPNNVEIVYTYNASGLIGSVLLQNIPGSTNTIAWASLNYAPHNQISSIQYANGTTTTNTYNQNALYRRTRTKTLKSNGTVIQDISYTYDPVGNITSIHDQSPNTTAKLATYVYDDIDRLIESVVTNSGNSQNYNQTYSYDGVGNILSSSDVGTYQYVDQGMNNPHAVTQAGAIPLVYDSRGNVTSYGATQYHYQWNNKMDQSDDGVISTSYIYDHEGNRILRTNNCLNQLSALCASIPVADQELTTSPEYIVRDTIPEITIQAEGVTLGTLENATAHYAHTDHVNSSSLITDQAGNTVQLLDYYPFGQTRVNEKSTTYDSKDKFTGHQHDEDTNLTYMLARYYQPQVKRFFSQDPASLVAPEQFLQDPQQLNSYSYARNNPLVYVDPDGEKLVVRGSLEFKQATISDLKKLSPAITYSKGSFGGYTVRYDNSIDIGKYSSGTNLLQDVVDANKTVKIKESKKADGGASATLKSFNKGINGQSTGSLINYNPFIERYYPLFDGVSGEVSFEPSPSFITLGHELIHAEHALLGDSQFSLPTSYMGLDGTSYYGSPEEVNTVFGTSNSIGENTLRAEHNLMPRNSYTTER